MASDQITYDASKFNPTPPNEFLCAICHCVLYQPRMCACRHIFCQVCIETWLNRSSTCPSCRNHSTLQQLQLAPPLVQNVLNSLTMDCEYKEKGCNLHVPMENFPMHISRCDYRAVYCPHANCTVETIMRQLQSHKEKCQHRIVKCQKLCRLPFPFVRLAGHICTTALKDRVGELDSLLHRHQMVLSWLRAKLNLMYMPHQVQFIQLQGFHETLNDINSFWPTDQPFPVRLCGTYIAPATSPAHAASSSATETSPEADQPRNSILERLVLEASAPAEPSQIVQPGSDYSAGSAAPSLRPRRAVEARPLENRVSPSHSPRPRESRPGPQNPNQSSAERISTRPIPGENSSSVVDRVGTHRAEFSTQSQRIQSPDSASYTPFSLTYTPSPIEFTDEEFTSYSDVDSPQQSPTSRPGAEGSSEARSGEYDMYQSYRHGRTAGDADYSPSYSLLDPPTYRSGHRSRSRSRSGTMDSDDIDRSRSDSRSGSRSRRYSRSRSRSCSRSRSGDDSRGWSRSRYDYLYRSRSRSRSRTPSRFDLRSVQLSDQNDRSRSRSNSRPDRSTIRSPSWSRSGSDRGSRNYYSIHSSDDSYSVRYDSPNSNRRWDPVTPTYHPDEDYFNVRRHSWQSSGQWQSADSGESADVPTRTSEAPVPPASSHMSEGSVDWIPPYRPNTIDSPDHSDDPSASNNWTASDDDSVTYSAVPKENRSTEHVSPQLASNQDVSALRGAVESKEEANTSTQNDNHCPSNEVPSSPDQPSLLDSSTNKASACHSRPSSGNRQDKEEGQEKGVCPKNRVSVNNVQPSSSCTPLDNNNISGSERIPNDTKRSKSDSNMQPIETDNDPQTNVVSNQVKAFVQESMRNVWESSSDTTSLDYDLPDEDALPSATTKPDLSTAPVDVISLLGDRSGEAGSIISEASTGHEKKNRTCNSSGKKNQTRNRNDDQPSSSQNHASHILSDSEVVCDKRGGKGRSGYKGKGKALLKSKSVQAKQRLLSSSACRNNYSDSKGKSKVKGRRRPILSSSGDSEEEKPADTVNNSNIISDQNRRTGDTSEVSLQSPSHSAKHAVKEGSNKGNVKKQTKKDSAHKKPTQPSDRNTLSQEGHSKKRKADKRERPGQSKKRKLDSRMSEVEEGTGSSCLRTKNAAREHATTSHHSRHSQSKRKYPAETATASQSDRLVPAGASRQGIALENLFGIPVPLKHHRSTAPPLHVSGNKGSIETGRSEQGGIVGREVRPAGRTPNMAVESTRSNRTSETAGEGARSTAPPLHVSGNEGSIETGRSEQGGIAGREVRPAGRTQNMTVESSRSNRTSETAVEGARFSRIMRIENVGGGGRRPAPAPAQCRRILRVETPAGQRQTSHRRGVEESMRMVNIPDLPIPPSTLELLNQYVDSEDSDSTWSPSSSEED